MIICLGLEVTSVIKLVRRVRLWGKGNEIPKLVYSFSATNLEKRIYIGMAVYFSIG